MSLNLQNLLLNLKIENQTETAKNLRLLRDLSSQIRTQKTIFQDQRIQNLEKNLDEKKPVKRLENQIESLSLSQRLNEITLLLKGIFQDQNQVTKQNDRLQVNWDRVWDEFAASQENGLQQENAEPSSSAGPLATEALQAQTSNIYSLVQQQRLENSNQKNEVHSGLETQKGILREQVRSLKKKSFWQKLLNFFMPLISAFLTSGLSTLFQLGAASLQKFLTKILNALSAKLLEFLQTVTQKPLEEKTEEEKIS